jgi:translation initiation factor 4B
LYVYAEVYDSGRKEKVILPTAPRATRSPDLDDEKIPKVPPFLAYISNLSYDVEESDISNFFRNLEVKLRYLHGFQCAETALHFS